MDIDISFDFSSDTPGYWDHFWENNGGHGSGGKNDPDALSPTLRSYHQMLWSKELPCGKFMDLEQPNDGYLRWDDLYFGSDSITTSFRYGAFPLIEDLEKQPGYREKIEAYIHKTYTIGGMMIFPVHHYSFNQARGMHRKIRDRWDLSLECIRRFYAGEESPLFKPLKSDADFYGLFCDFRGFVDYFYLQDCVTDDYQVKMWMEGIPFERPAFPQTIEEYCAFLQEELDFVQKRNKRIDEAVNNIISNSVLKEQICSEI